MDQVFIEEGEKFVPQQRFNLKAAKSSTAFGKSDNTQRRRFEVKRHPIVQSIKAEEVKNLEVQAENSTDKESGSSQNAVRIAKRSRPIKKLGSSLELSDSQKIKEILSQRPFTGHLAPEAREKMAQKEKAQEKGETHAALDSERRPQYPSSVRDEVYARYGYALNVAKTDKVVEKYLRKKDAIIWKERSEGLGSLIGALLENKRLIPDYPIIEDESKLTSDSVLTCVDGSECMIPDIKVSPYNNNLFYYEEMVNNEGKPDGYVGRVSLKFDIVELASNMRFLPIEIDTVCLNLKTSKEIIKIEGKIDLESHSLVFDLMGEAVKIAFLNLASKIEANQCDIDLFCKFVGYSLQKRVSKVFKLMKPMLKETKIERKSLKRKAFLSPEVVVPVASKTKFLRNMDKVNQPGKASDEVLHVKSSFIVRINKPLSFPLESNQSLYRNINGIIKGNPFKLNDDFSEYRQIFCPGINREIVSVYKSLFTKNNFLLFPNKYYIARNSDQPCINSTYFLSEEGVIENEQEISVVSFSFNIAPALSEFDLAKMKMILRENGLLDKELSIEESKNKYLEEIRFNFPNDVGAESMPGGDEFLATANLTHDGQYFNIICETNDLGKASLFITDINGAIPRFFNILSKHKEIFNSAVVELDMNKTTGEFLNWEISNDELLIINTSYSPCHISNVMLLNKEGDVFYNTEYFQNAGNLGSGEYKSIKIKDLTNRAEFLKPVKVFVEYESIEDISKEFRQEIDQITSYYLNVILDFSNIAEKGVYSMRTEVTHTSSGISYPFVIEKKDFDKPIPLTIITKNEVESTSVLQISRMYYDKSGNFIKKDSLQWDYSKGSTIDLSLKKQE